MLDLLIQVLIFAIVFGAIWYILSLLPIPHPFSQIIRVIIIVIAVIWVLYLLLALIGHAPSGPRLRPL